MTDSHCHLSSTPLLDNLDRELELFTEMGGNGILNVSGDLSDIPKIINQKMNINNKFSDLISAAIGIHPEYLEKLSIDKVHQRLNKFENYVDEYINEIDAIGETGLDYHQMPRNREEAIQTQKLAFRRHLTKAKKHNLPLTIHSREENGSDECIKDTLNLIIEEGEGKLRGSLHSYTGLAEYVPKILDLGFYIGFNAIITYKSGENVRENLRKTPLDRVLLETDGPWLPLRGKNVAKYGTPRNVADIAEVVSEVKGFSVGKVLSQVDENFRCLFS